MKVIHFLKDITIEGESSSLDIFLSLNGGDYLWFSEGKKSRYQGWFTTFLGEEGKTAWKIIEDISIKDASPCDLIKHNLSSISRRRGDVEETFSLKEGGGILSYSLSEEREIEITLDVRESFSQKESQYKITKGAGVVFIEAKGEKESIFLVIKGAKEVKGIKEKEKREYLFDKERNSPPFKREVFRALSLTGKDFHFSVTKSKKKALEKIGEEREMDRYERMPLDFACAANALNGLYIKEKPGIYAGYPWFFQFWQRDEAISLKGLYLINKKIAKEVFLKLLEEEPIGPLKNHMADGRGWVFNRANLFLDSLNEKEKSTLKEEIKKETDKVLSQNMEDGLIISGPKETWMDSLERSGARIEIQALYLSLFKLGKEIDERNRENYAHLEEEMKRRVKEVFWNGSYLKDGKEDDSIRPNLFLTHYLYPDLLEKKEWETCFQVALEKLWLNWGGLATLDKNHPSFEKEHTGEDSRSYHQGDSWYFINNLAAISLQRVNRGKFSFYIHKMMESAREELLFRGAPGHLSELSSTTEALSQGAISQAWSNATYLEAVFEIYKIGRE